MDPHWFQLYIGTVFGLLPIANPFSTAPIFAAITSKDENSWRNAQARKAALNVFIILAIALVAGLSILNAFGISFYNLRLTGGVMVIFIAFKMLYPKDVDKQSDEEEEESVKKDDVSFTPIAMPSLSGPGAMMVSIGLGTGVKEGQYLDYLPLLAGIATVAIICWLVLRAATTVAQKFGGTGLNVLTRVMGFLLFCVGVQFMLTGVKGCILEVGTQFLQENSELIASILK